jgi:carbon-monoxide dehydrogenase small subunit
MTAIRLTVNGRAIEADVSPRTHLADFLREHVLLTGTHIGCEHGICGACTVEIDGEISRSCITYAVACDGATVRTIESFDDDALMEKMRVAFKANHALQCGYCTPGMLVAACDLVRRKTGLSRDEIRTEMSGNLCRCTGYVGIVNAIESVMQSEANTPRAVTAARWLGPAPGPVSEAAMPPEASAARAGPAKAAPMANQSASRASARAPIAVTVGQITEVNGATCLTQSFALPHARETVWALMSDPVAVAACIPGLSLGEPQPDGTWPGRMDVALGPIKASFAGQGSIQSFPDAYRQVIEGRGGDKRSGSQAQGRVDYRLVPEGDATCRVEVEISYVLAGPLAQVGRSAIVRDLVRRIGESFAQALDARLSGEAIAPVQPIGGFGLLLQLLRDRLADVWQGLMGRRG